MYSFTKMPHLKTSAWDTYIVWFSNLRQLRRNWVMAITLVQSKSEVKYVFSHNLLFTPLRSCLSRSVSSADGGLARHLQLLQVPVSESESANILTPLIQEGSQRRWCVLALQPLEGKDFCRVRRLRLSRGRSKVIICWRFSLDRRRPLEAQVTRWPHSTPFQKASRTTGRVSALLQTCWEGRSSLEAEKQVGTRSPWAHRASERRKALGKGTSKEGF